MDELIDRLPGGFVAFTDDGLIQSANLPIAAMFGFDRDELVGRHLESLLTVPSRIFYHTHILPLLKMQGHLSEVYISGRGKGGEEIPLLLNGSRNSTGPSPVNECLVTAMRRRNEYEDEILRAKRQAEEANAELHRLRASLETRIQERTSDLNFALAEMEGFTYTIAHDLRAPLRAIVATSALIHAEEGERLSPVSQQLLERQKFNALKLASLVDDLLQLSRLGVNPILRQPVDLSQMAREVAAATLSDHQRNDVRFTIEEGVETNGDRSMLHIVLQNLFDNAVKYSPGGGRVEFGLVRNAADCAYFVRDQGIGIDPAYAQKIFQPFERLHAEGEFPGNGIGLANVDRIIRRHGGRIWVDSEPGHGATFYFTLGEPQ